MQTKLLPAEFRSGNSIPVTQSTIKRERMVEIIADVSQAVLPDDTVALLTAEVVRLTGIIEQLEAEKRKAG